MSSDTSRDTGLGDGCSSVVCEGVHGGLRLVAGGWLVLVKKLLRIAGTAPAGTARVNLFLPLRFVFEVNKANTHNSRARHLQ